MAVREEYPYSLDRQTEHVFLAELANVLDVALWRADEIEACVEEQLDLGATADRPSEAGRWLHTVSGDTRLFGSIEAFLAAWARTSLILYPVKKRDKAENARNEGRGKHLRAALGIRDPGLSAGFDNRRLRDGWMHLDEDLGRWAHARGGDVSPSATTGEHTEWYHLAQRGSIRVVDSKELAVALPLRGIWRLRPYFQRCKDLRQQVQRTRDSHDRWLCHKGICGLAVGWGGEPSHWMVKALGASKELTVEAPTYPEAERAFIAEIDKMVAE